MNRLKVPHAIKPGIFILFFSTEERDNCLLSLYLTFYSFFYHAHKGIKLLKTKIFLITIFLILLTLILASNISAQEEKILKRGFGGVISKEKLLEKIEKGESITGHVIKGYDLSEIIKNTVYEIEINFSIIEGGLNLPTLIKNRITINSSEILPGPHEVAVSASNLFFYKGFNCAGTTISGGVDFSGAIFNGYVDFSETIFNGVTDFSKTYFKESVFFSGAIFNKRARFSYANFNNMADFSFSLPAGLTPPLDYLKKPLTGAVFNEDVTFVGAIFNGVSFRKAAFHEKADISWSIFNGAVFFSNATFNKLAIFKGAEFLNTLVLDSAVFKEAANFRAAKIKRLSYDSAESPVIIEGRFDFRNATITEAHFQDIIFEKDIDFSDVEFGVPLNKESERVHDCFSIVFKFVTFESDAYFIRTNFSGNTALENINFKKRVDFTDADFTNKMVDCKQNFSLSYINFQNLLIKWGQLPDTNFWMGKTKDKIKSFRDIEREKLKEKGEDDKKEERSEEKLQPLSQVLEGFEKIFRSQNQLSDANKSYYHMKNAELREKSIGKAFWQWFPGQIHWSLWWITCGYGTKFWWILGWSIFFNLFFAIIYCIKGHLKKQPHPETKQEFIFKLRFFDFPRHYLTQNSKGNSKGSLEKFINAFIFSFVVLFKIGYRDTTISGRILGIDYKYIVWLGWVVGYYLLAALIVTLFNTMPIINKLLSSVF